MMLYDFNLDGEAFYCISALSRTVNTNYVLLAEDLVPILDIVGKRHYINAIYRYSLQASTTEERNEWIAAMNKVRDFAQTASQLLHEWEKDQECHNCIQGT